MNGIADKVRNILLLEAFAAEAKRLAGEHRTELETKARKQLEEDGVAPSWALPEIAKVTLSVTHQAAYVSDVDKFAAWVAVRHPEAVERITRVRADSQARIMAGLNLDDGVPVDKSTGEIVPGVAIREGGRPDKLSVRPDAGIKAALSETVTQMLATAHPEITGPSEELPKTPDDPWIPSGDPFAAFPARGVE